MKNIPRKQRQGFTLVELLVVIAIIGVLVGMLLPAVQNVREAARRTQCLNRMRQIGLATIMFHDSHEAFPPGRLFPKKFSIPPLNGGGEHPSWFVRILPFLGEQAVFEQWDLSKAYTDHDDAIVSRPLVSFLCPSRRTTQGAVVETAVREVELTSPCGCGGWTFVRVVGGATGDYGGNNGDLSPGSTGAASDYYYAGNATGVIISCRARINSDRSLTWIEADRVSYTSITDGSSNTALLGELHFTPETINMTPFNGPIFNGEDLAAFTRIGGPGVPLRSRSEPATSIVGFGSWHPGTCNFVNADGSTKALNENLDTVTLGQICNRKDGEAQRVE